MLGEELPKLGCEVKVITYGDIKMSNDKCRPPAACLSGRQGEAGTTNAEEIYRISRKQNIVFRYFKYFWQVWKMSKWADIVYAHDLVSVGLPCALAKLLKPKTKLIVRLGGDFLWEKAYNNGWTDKPLRTYYQEPKNLKEKIFLAIYKFVLNKCDKIIFSTTWQKDIYRKYLKVKDNKTIIIDNAFPDLDKSNYESKIINKRILLAGRLIKLKNFSAVFKAVEDIKDVGLVVIGEGEIDIDKRAEFKPKISQTELKQEILNSFLVIVPSITEISPNLVLECIKLGKPILVTKECGFYDKYKDKLIFINPFNQEDIKKNIVSLLDEGNYDNYINKIRTIDVSRGAKELALDHYNIFKNL